jgi:hypothetical protein
LPATILHDAGAADHFEIGHFCQLGQNVVLHAIGKECVLFFVAKIFKRQHCNTSRQWMPREITFRNDPTRGRCESDQRRRQERTGRIASHPFFSASEDSSVTRQNWLML